MLSVQLICVGKLKEAYWRDACSEYAKRLSAYCKFSIIEVDESHVPENASQAQINTAIESEGGRILKKIPTGSKVITLCIEGKPISSEALSKQIDTLAVNGANSISFIIGGSWGLSEEVKRQSILRLSMSVMTFPHQLARVMMCEQLYRAFQISSGGKYHK